MIMNNIGVIEKSNERIVVLDLASKQLQSNLIMINGEITQESVSEWQAMLFYLMSKLTPEESKKNPIQIYINSYGGSVYDGLGLYDTIQNLIKKGYTVRTVNIGVCASMAAIILMAGSKGYRQSFPNSSTMIHELSYSDFGKISEMKDSVKEAERLQKILDNIIKDSTNCDIKSFERKDVWFNAQEALEKGIIDSIL